MGTMSVHECTSVRGCPACWCSRPALMHSRSFAGAQSVPPEHFVLFFLVFVFWPPEEQRGGMASAHCHEFFIQPTDAADGEKTDPAAAEPAVQEEQEENHVSVNDGMHLYGAFFY